VTGDEELGVFLVCVSGQGEGGGAVARLAAVAELAEVDVLVARRALVRDAGVAHRAA